MHNADVVLRQCRIVFKEEETMRNHLFGIIDGTALKAIGGALEKLDLGWPTAVTKISEEERTFEEVRVYRVLANKGMASFKVTLKRRHDGDDFPFSSVAVQLGPDFIWTAVTFEISERGDFTPVYSLA